MIDEGELRRRFPEIPWDQPVEVQILPPSMKISRRENEIVVSGGSLTRWVCRYCIAMHGVKAKDVRAGTVDFAFSDREQALDHIEQAHHD